MLNHHKDRFLRLVRLIRLDALPQLTKESLEIAHVLDFLGEILLKNQQLLSRFFLLRVLFSAHQ